MRLQSLAGGSGCFAEHSGFLVDGEAARRGLLHEAGGYFGQRLLERGAVEAAASDGLPSDLERASQKRVIIAHGLLDFILGGLDFCIELITHALKLHQFGDLGGQVRIAHFLVLLD